MGLGDDSCRGHTDATLEEASAESFLTGSNCRSSAIVASLNRGYVVVTAATGVEYQGSAVLGTLNGLTEGAPIGIVARKGRWSKDG